MAQPEKKRRGRPRKDPDDRIGSAIMTIGLKQGENDYLMQASEVLDFRSASDMMRTLALAVLEGHPDAKRLRRELGVRDPTPEELAQARELLTKVSHKGGKISVSPRTRRKAERRVPKTGPRVSERRRQARSPVRQAG